MKPMKVKNAMKSVKTGSTLKFTKTRSADPTRQTKPKATTKSFKTNERSRIYSRAYRKKITELKELGGCNPEEASKLARAYAKEILMHNGFSIRG